MPPSLVGERWRSLAYPSQEVIWRHGRVALLFGEPIDRRDDFGRGRLEELAEIFVRRSNPQAQCGKRPCREVGPDEFVDLVLGEGQQEVHYGKWEQNVRVREDAHATFSVFDPGFGGGLGELTTAFGTAFAASLELFDVSETDDAVVAAF